MDQTFYGVDIVLLPERKRGRELHEQGKVIEINGLNSGASFYRIGDLSFYRRVMQEMAKHAHGRILLPYDPEWEFKRRESPELKKAKEQVRLEQLTRTQKWQNTLTTNPPTNFFSVHDHIVEKSDWEHKSEDQFKRSMSSFYLKAARELGIDVDSLIGLVSSGGLVKYTRKEIDPTYLKQFSQEFLDGDEPLAELPSGTIPPTTLRDVYLPIEEVGLIWYNLSKEKEQSMGRRKFLNGFFAEAVLKDKALFYLYSRFLAKEKRVLEKFLPSSFLYGLGMHTQKDFREWFSSCKTDLFVKKPLFEAHGIGVGFMTREEMKRYDRSPFYNPSPNAVREGYRKLVMDLVLGDINLSQETVIFQEAVESMKVEDPGDGKKYTACARAIVQNGKFVKAMWRSSQKDDTEPDLTARLRHNVTNGASILPVSERDSRTLAEIAEAAVDSFETTNENIKAQLTGKKVSYMDELVQGRKDVDHDLLVLQHMFYLGKIKRAAAYHGVNIPDVLDEWLSGISIQTDQSSSFVEKIKEFNASL